MELAFADLCGFFHVNCTRSRQMVAVFLASSEHIGIWSSFHMHVHCRLNVVQEMTFFPLRPMMGRNSILIESNLERNFLIIIYRIILYQNFKIPILLGRPFFVHFSLVQRSMWVQFDTKLVNAPKKSNDLRWCDFPSATNYHTKLTIQTKRVILARRARMQTLLVFFRPMHDQRMRN